MDLRSVLGQEFQLKKFGFSGVKADRFCNFQWRLPVMVYLCYRFLLMSYAVVWLVYISPPRSFIAAEYLGNKTLRSNNATSSFPAWGAFLTIWSYITLNIYLIIHFLAALVYHIFNLTGQRNVSLYCCSRPNFEQHTLMFVEVDNSLQNATGYEDIPDSSEFMHAEVVMSSRPPLYMCIAWMFFNVISTAGVMVTIVFFAFLFRLFPGYPSIDLENLQVHLINSVIIILEHLVTAVPFRLLHVIYPLLYGAIYMVFSIIYWTGDHRRVLYPGILDWNKPWPTIGFVLMIGLVIIPILHAFFFLIHKVKMAIYHCL